MNTLNFGLFPVLHFRYSP